MSGSLVVRNAPQFAGTIPQAKNRLATAIKRPAYLRDADASMQHDYGLVPLNFRQTWHSLNWCRFRNKLLEFVLAIKMTLFTGSFAKEAIHVYLCTCKM